MIIKSMFHNEQPTVEIYKAEYERLKAADERLARLLEQKRMEIEIHLASQRRRL